MKWLFIIFSFLLSRSLVWGVPINEPKNKGTNESDIDIEAIKKDVTDILSMIPREKVTAIAMKHLEEDDGFKLAVKYMTEPEWIKLVAEVRKKPEWIAFKNHLDSFGIPVDILIHCLEVFVQNVTIGPVKDKNATRNLTEFIEEVEGIIPITDILVKFNEKMQSNQNMQILIEKLSEPKSKKIFEDALKLAEVRKMLNELKDMGLNLYDLFSMLYVFLGWGEFKM